MLYPEHIPHQEWFLLLRRSKYHRAVSVCLCFCSLQIHPWYSHPPVLCSFHPVAHRIAAHLLRYVITRNDLIQHRSGPPHIFTWARTAQKVSREPLSKVFARSFIGKVKISLSCFCIPLSSVRPGIDSVTAVTSQFLSCRSNVRFRREADVFRHNAKQQPVL